MNDTFKIKIFRKYLTYVAKNRKNAYKDYLYGRIYDKAIFHYNYYFIAVYHFFKNDALKCLKFSHNFNALNLINQTKKGIARNSDKTNLKQELTKKKKINIYQIFPQKYLINVIMKKLKKNAKRYF